MPSSPTLSLPPMGPIDIVILSNGPGEVTTWVKPVVRSLRERYGDDRAQVRISVILSPCPNATGREAAIVRQYPEVDRVQAAASFFSTLLGGRTAADWPWRDRGVVIFLGGDQLFPVIIGRRLGYKTLIYAEWEARWGGWVDRFAVMTPQVIATVAPAHRHKCTVVGDLMADLEESQAAAIAQVQAQLQVSPTTELIGLLPGSKAAKLAMGLPLCLAIAARIQAARPQTRFVIPVAPTLTVAELAQFADPAANAVIPLVQGVSAQLIPADATHPWPRLLTPSGLEVILWSEVPAPALLSQCRFCLTTIGANTAELGALAVPMMVLIATQQRDAMRAWDGLLGLLVNLPGVGRFLAMAMNTIILRTLGDRLLAWPNIWAGRRIVPELIGALDPQVIADLALEWLREPDQLAAIRADLRSVRGAAGAAARLTALVPALLEEEE